MPAIKTKITKEVLTFVTLNIFYSASSENYKWLFFLDSSNPVEIIYFPSFVWILIYQSKCIDEFEIEPQISSPDHVDVVHSLA